MATHTLTADTLISSLMPSGGGALASGDTIELAGHSLIVDADAVDCSVTIANSGADANLELRDLGRIKLNATLPSNVHPWIDPAHPLPVSAEPGIDGDPYRTPLTANARAEIQLNGNFGLGGGAASLPTETRDGNMWAFVASPGGQSNEIIFDREMPIHVGDRIKTLTMWNALESLTVSSYVSNMNLAGFSPSPARRTAGDLWFLCSGGVVINCLTTNASTILTANMAVGTLNVLGVSGQQTSVLLSGASLRATVATFCISTNVASGAGAAIAGGAVFASFLRLRGFMMAFQTGHLSSHATALSAMGLIRLLRRAPHGMS